MRPTKLTKETINDLFNAIKDGNTILDSCMLAGISEATYYNWKHSKEPEFLEFFRGT